MSLKELSNIELLLFHQFLDKEYNLYQEINDEEKLSNDDVLDILESENMISKIVLRRYSFEWAI